jgi:hypothetical protein
MMGTSAGGGLRWRALVGQGFLPHKTRIGRGWGMLTLIGAGFYEI